MAKDTTPEEPESTSLDEVADRLEAALERIVRKMDAPHPAEAVAGRLDRLIVRLRDALHGAADQN